MSLAFRFLHRNGKTSNQGDATWNCPLNDKHAEWMEPDENNKGYYLSTTKGLCYWIDRELYVAEYQEAFEVTDDSLIVPKARLLTRITSWGIKKHIEYINECVEQAKALRDKENQEHDRVIECLMKAQSARYLKGVTVESSRIIGEDLGWHTNLLRGYINEELCAKFPNAIFA